VFGYPPDFDLAAAGAGELVQAHQVRLGGRRGLAFAQLVQARDWVSVR
jgi:hypothetical protein